MGANQQKPGRLSIKLETRNYKKTSQISHNQNHYLKKLNVHRQVDIVTWRFFAMTKDASFSVSRLLARSIALGRECPQDTCGSAPSPHWGRRAVRIRPP